MFSFPHHPFHIRSIQFIFEFVVIWPCLASFCLNFVNYEFKQQCFSNVKFVPNFTNSASTNQTPQNGVPYEELGGAPYEELGADGAPYEELGADGAEYCGCGAGAEYCGCGAGAEYCGCGAGAEYCGAGAEYEYPDDGAGAELCCENEATWIDGIVFSSSMATTRADGCDGTPYCGDGAPYCEDGADNELDWLSSRNKI